MVQALFLPLLALTTAAGALAQLPPALVSPKLAATGAVGLAVGFD